MNGPRKIVLAEGNFIKAQLPSGAVVQGRFFGVTPAGKVVMEMVIPDELKDVIPKEDTRRLVSLDEASSVNVFDREGQALSEQARIDNLQPRFSYARIRDAIRNGDLVGLVRRRAGGPRMTVVEEGMDRRAGEMVPMPGTSLNGTFSGASY